MVSLIKFELKKMFNKKITWISVVIIIGFSFVMSYSTLQNLYAFDGAGDEGSGARAVEIEKLVASKYEGIITDEKVQKILSDFKPKGELNGINVSALVQNSTQAAIFDRFADMDGNWNGVSVEDVFGNEEVKMGYVDGWIKTSRNLSQSLVLLAVVIIVLIAPIFSSEYGCMDSIILTTKYGKGKSAIAKITTSLIVAIILTAVVIVFNLVFAYISYGSDGLDCSTLFATNEYIGGYIPFNITYGTAIIYQVVLAFSGVIGVVGVILVLSALCNSTLTAHVLSAFAYFAPAFTPISKGSTLSNYILLSPFYNLQYTMLMSVEQMRNGYLFAIKAVYTSLIITLVGSVLSCLLFKKHEVK